jgi:2-methylcitrate dehydratase PrpD
MSASPSKYPDVTNQLAQYVLATRAEDLPAHVRTEGTRSLLNVLGCSIGGARHDAVNSAETALAGTTGSGPATVFGRGHQADILHATLINCLAASVYGYDDTHAQAIVHPSGPVMAAVLALCERMPVSGRDALTAFALGVEINCRLSKAISIAPAKSPVAWSQTGITCAIGTALAAGKLLGLDAAHLRAAVGIAASQCAGIRSLHGTMCTALMPAHAGQTGLRAALLAQAGFTGGNTALEGHNGYFDVFGTNPDIPALIGNLGSSFELLKNTYKAHPGGIVIHPILDACLLLLREHALKPEQVEGIEVYASANAMALCNRPHPKDEFEAHVSMHHWVSATLHRGVTGVEVMNEECVHDPAISAFQDRIKAVADDSLMTDAAKMSVTLKDGRVLKVHIEHCLGSASNPMPDAQLDAKFSAQSVPVVGPERTRKLIELCRGIDGLADAGVIAKTAA